MTTTTIESFLTRAAEARELVDINIAAGEAAQALQAQRKRRLTQMLWMIVIALFVSDLLPIGPVELGLLPDIHIFGWLTGHSYAVEAGHALYHVDVDSPHILGVTLPWGTIF